MGGYGSGRRGARPVAEHTQRLRIGRLRQPLQLISQAAPGEQPRHAGRLRWPNGASVEYLLGKGAGGVWCVLSCATERGTRHDTIEIVTTPCPAGGARFWFLCPCGRRAGVLYAPAGRLRCRRCHKITYQSSNATDPRVRRILRGDLDALHTTAGELPANARHAARQLASQGADLLVLLKAHTILSRQYERAQRRAMQALHRESRRRCRDLRARGLIPARPHRRTAPRRAQPMT